MSVLLLWEARICRGVTGGCQGFGGRALRLDRILGFSVAVAAGLWGGGAWAQAPAPLSMMLSCSGTIVEQRKISGEVRAPGQSQGAEIESSTLVNVAARLSVAVKDGAVRLFPGPYLAPNMFQKKSPDGWYDLTDVAIGDNAIDGKAPYGGLYGKLKLHIDRRTGDVSFGGFHGACEKTSDQPEARKF